MTQTQTVVRVPQGYRVGGWRTTRALASGSWSSVYAAERHPDEPAGGPSAVALKFVPTGTLTNRQLAFLADMTGREVSVGQRVTHPRLVRLYETHVIDDPEDPRLDGATVLVLELADRSAAAVLDTVDGGLADAPRIITEICAGLAHLHAAGWVHGDLKPSNVLLMADGSVRLADFGLAAEIDGTHAYLPPGGTADYVPPERAGEDLGTKGVAVRQTADIWALGVTACQLLTGRLPFPGVTSRARSAAAAAYAGGKGTLTLPAGLPPAWHGFVADCLSADHKTRMRHGAGDLLRRAEALTRESGPITVPPAPAKRSRRALVAAAALGGILGIGGTTLAVLQPWHTAPTETPVQAGQYFNPAKVPAKYHSMIVRAGTKCPAEPSVTPLYIAALLKAESNFDENLWDAAKDEYGIARWTPTVLQYQMPAGQRTRIPAPPFPPELSIRAMGDYLCDMSRQLEDLPGDAKVNLAAAYRSSVTKVRAAEGPPPQVTAAYLNAVKANLEELRPVNR
jgi:serine/threonine protein kinase